MPSISPNSLVKAEFAACKREDDSILRCLLGKLRVIVAS